MVINDRCIKCGVSFPKFRMETDKPSARIVCDNCSGMNAMEPRAMKYQGIEGQTIEPEEVVKVFVNQVERSYIEYCYDSNVPGPAMRVLEKVKINVTAANADIKATMDLEVDPVTLVTIHGVPDYEETARRVIKYLASGII